MIRQNSYLKAVHVLQKFSLGELQAHVSIVTPYKYGKKSGKTVIRDRDIIVEGTRMPASTLDRFVKGLANRRGGYHMRERSVDKLAAFYDRYYYNKLKAIGVQSRLSNNEARRYSKFPPERLRHVMDQYYQWSRRIQDNYLYTGRIVRRRYIEWGMARSINTWNDWEQVSKVSGLKKKKSSYKKSKRPKQYEH